jgi:hypothetical protein
MSRGLPGRLPCVVPERTVVLEVQSPLRPADVERLERLLTTTAHVVCRLAGVLDLATVDSLARLHLAARRQHGSITFRVDDSGLLDLTGLLTAVPGLEVVGEPEHREDPLGVQEVVDVDDPPV